MRSPLLRIRSLAFAAVLVLVFAPPARALTVGAVGDSLTDEYGIWLSQYLTPMPQILPTNPQPSGPNPLNWVEQLATDRASELSFGAFGSYAPPRYTGYAQNWARAGATSATLLSEGGGQHNGVAAQGLDLVYVGIGTNNFAPFTYPALGLVDVYGGIHNGCQTLSSCSTPFTGSNGLAYSSVETYVDAVVNEIFTALGVIQGSGASIVLGTLADWGDFPSFLVSFPVGNGGAYSNPVGQQLVSDAVDLVNAALIQYAQSNGIPVVDVQALIAAGDGSLPLSLGGIAIQPGAPGGTRNATRFFLPDGTHPDTLVQGIFANAIIAAANGAYATGLTPLGDAEILANAGLSPDSGWDGIDFDASVFVLAPEPGAAGLAAAAVVCGLLGLGRSRREGARRAG